MQGQVGADTLSITDSPIVVTNQTLGLTTSSTLDFTRASCDGIFVRTPSMKHYRSSTFLCTFLCSSTFFQQPSVVRSYKRGMSPHLGPGVML